jgi:Flp pilus assembly protein TadG
MMKLQCAFEAGRRRPWLSRPNGEGGGAVAFAAAAPLIVLAVAVAADHAHVSRFRTQVQLAAGAASLAAAGAIARHPEISGDSVGARVASAVFARNAPRGASGTLSVAATSTDAVVTATVGYNGVAPSNFGSALGYGAFHVSVSATSRALVADSQTIASP